MTHKSLTWSAGDRVQTGMVSVAETRRTGRRPNPPPTSAERRDDAPELLATTALGQGCFYRPPRESSPGIRLVSGGLIELGEGFLFHLNDDALHDVDNDVIRRNRLLSTVPSDCPPWPTPLNAISLASGLAGCAEHRSDRRPRMAVGSGSCYGLREFGFDLSTREGGPMHGGQRAGTSAFRGIRLEPLEALRELLRLLDDLLHTAWHRYHLRNFGRAPIAWRITGAVPPGARGDHGLGRHFSKLPCPEKNRKLPCGGRAGSLGGQEPRSS